MAASGRSGIELKIENQKRDDFRESCSMCLEPYAGRTPKLLPCFHTFCLPCLTALAESVVTTRKANLLNVTIQPESEEKQGREDEVNSLEEHQPSSEVEYLENEAVEKSGRNDGDGEKGEEEGVLTCAGDAKPGAVFMCPTCRAPVTVPTGGVSALQTNFYIVTEPEEAAQPVPCEMCEEAEGRKEAEYACSKCQQRMCRTCRSLHDKIVDKDEHQVKPLSLQEKTPSSRHKAEVKKCGVHQDQELYLFCLDCDVGICVVCKLASHQSHSTEDITAVALRAQEELGSMVTAATEQIHLMQRRMTRLSKDVKELSRQQQEAENDLNARHAQIVHWADMARDEILETLFEEAERTLLELKAEERSSFNLINSLCGLVSRAASTNDNAEVLLLKKELEASLLEREKREWHERESKRTEHKNFLSLDGELSAVDLVTVRAYLGEVSVGKGEVVPSVSLRERMEALVEGKLEKMKTSLSTDLETVEEGLKTKVQELRAKMDTVVAFHADGVDPSTSIKAYEKVVFDNTMTNIGSAFNKNTGTFHAPVSGLYCFHATVLLKHMDKHKDIKMPICINLCRSNNNHTVKLAEASSLDGRQIQSSISAVVPVMKNECIFLKNASWLEIQVVGKTQNPCTTFHGFLMKAD